MLPIQKSVTKPCSVDSKIGGKIAPLPILKLTAKLWCCRFKNRQPNYVAADSEIDN
jgi:hypothetical protein